MSHLAPGRVLLPLLVIVVPFTAFCLVDLARAGQVRYLPKWAWALVICASVPWGGLAYLAFGKVRKEPGVAVGMPPAGAPAVPPGGAVAAAVPGPVRRAPSGRSLTIEVDSLTKRFGTVTAVNGLSFSVRPGHVTGFLGPNGAGKPNIGI